MFLSWVELVRWEFKAYCSSTQPPLELKSNTLALHIEGRYRLVKKKRLLNFNVSVYAEKVTITRRPSVLKGTLLWI